MKFDFCIGNPPYQESRQGDSNTATPVYHHFMEAAYSVSSKTMLITPARFLFKAGYTPDSWNEKMLNDEHFKVVSYMPDSADAFNGVDIKGGVAITYRDRQKQYEPIGIFIRYEEMKSILEKTIGHRAFCTIKDIVVSSFAYHFTDALYKENPELLKRASKGHDLDIQSNTFSVFPELYSDSVPDNSDYVRILGKDGRNRTWKYIKRKYITIVANLDAFKVFYSKATGSGQFGEVLPDAIIGNPGDGATVTYISIGRFNSLLEAQNCEKYTKSKFARALLGILKVTQDNTPEKWKYVPLQDFSPNSDINWMVPLKVIDQQLYRKYGLTDEEIHFIETHVKEMN